MLRSAMHLQSYTIDATDGQLGKVKDFLFDDRMWVVRFVVADTRKWLPGRRVLISPQALGEPDWKAGTLPVELTCKQVRDCPPLAEHEPVSRQHQLELQRRFGWVPHWAGPATLTAPAGIPPTIPTTGKRPPGQEEEEGDDSAADPHLRSLREVTGYHVRAQDGEIGHVDDYLIDDDGWGLRYAVVDTRNWVPGRRVLLARTWFTEVDWEKRQVRANLKRQQIRESPDYVPTAVLNRHQEQLLHQHYGDEQPYWEQADESTPSKRES